MSLPPITFILQYYNMPESSKFSNIPYWVLALIMYIINIGLVIYFNPLNVMTDNTKIATFFFVFAGFINFLLFSYFSIKPPNTQTNLFGFLYNIGKILSMLFIFYGLIYAVFYYVVYTPWPLTIMVSLLNIISIVGLMALVREYFFKNSNTNTGDSSTIGKVFEFLKSAIFYIPHLLIQFVDFVKDQHNITTKTTWIVLLIEIIIIGLRFVIPFLYEKFHKTKGSLLERGPIYLNNEKDLGVFQNNSVDANNNSNKEQNFNYNYAISSWIWINPHPESTGPAYNKSTQLLNYGDVLKINFNKNRLEFWALTTENSGNTSFNSNKQVMIYELSPIPYQKWNSIVVNYDGGTLDIFINNLLVSSTINITPVMYNKKVTSGEAGGINGGIKDVIYYNKILSKNDIYSIYTSG